MSRYKFCYFGRGRFDMDQMEWNKKEIIKVINGRIITTMGKFPVVVIIKEN